MPLTDSVLFPVSGLHVSFWMRSYDQYTSIVVGVMSNPADTNTPLCLSTPAKSLAFIRTLGRVLPPTQVRTAT